MNAADCNVGDYVETWQYNREDSDEGKVVCIVGSEIWYRNPEGELKLTMPGKCIVVPSPTDIAEAAATFNKRPKGRTPFKEGERPMDATPLVLTNRWGPKVI